MTVHGGSTVCKLVLCSLVKNQFLAWAWLALKAKPKANVVIPKNKPLPKDLRTKTSKSAKYHLPLCYKERPVKITIYFIPSSEFNTYLKQIKVILSAVKKYRIFSLVTNTIYIFSLQQTEAVSSTEGLISSRKDLECTNFV